MRQASERARRIADAALAIASALDAAGTPSERHIERSLTRAFGASGPRAYDDQDREEALEGALVAHYVAHAPKAIAGARDEWEALAWVEEQAARLPPRHARGRARRASQHYPTPPGIAYVPCVAAGLRPGHRILEPSAGLGLLAALGRATEPVTLWHLNEHDPVRRAAIALLVPEVRTSGADASCARTLRCAAEHGYDAVLMNPPFGASAGKPLRNADAAHIAAAATALAPGARLVGISSAGLRPGRAAHDNSVGADPHNATLWWNTLCPRLWSATGTSVRAQALVIERERAPRHPRPFDARHAQHCESAAALLGSVLTTLGTRCDEHPNATSPASSATGATPQHL